MQESEMISRAGMDEVDIYNCCIFGRCSDDVCKVAKGKIWFQPHFFYVKIS